MEIGVGLPTTVDGVTGREIVEWARRAEQLGFASLATLDRLVHRNVEPLVALAAAAAVTERVRLATAILIASYRTDVALLAKQLASIDLLAPGRLVVGVAAGGRQDDFEVAGADYTRRGANLDGLVVELRRLWSGSAIPGFGPVPRRPPPILVGGHSPAAYARAARLGDGWIAGGGSVSAYGDRLDRARAAWRAAGRAGQPRAVALAYVDLGPGAEGSSRRHVADYYEHMGPGAQRLLAQVAHDGPAVRALVSGYAAAGCEELLLFPCSSDPCQLDALAEALAPAALPGQQAGPPAAVGAGQPA